MENRKEQGPFTRRTEEYSTVLKGFESMSRVMESAMKRVGERLVEEGRRRDRVDREIEERVCRLEERLAD